MWVESASPHSDPPLSFPPMPTFGLGPGRRVAVVHGVRTPFAKAGTVLKNISAQDLGKLAVTELLQRTELNGKEVQAVVVGTVVPNIQAPNNARDRKSTRLNSRQ